MKKNLSHNSEEIDLTILFKVIFKKKIKILLITIASFLVGLGYSFFTPKNYLVSLAIFQNDNYKFYELEHINQLLVDKNSLNNEIILDKFINELKAIKLNENIRSLKIIRKGQDYIINFKSNSTNEALKVLEKTIKLTSNNLKKSIYESLYASLDREKNRIIFLDSLRVKFLKEHSRIAKELNISDIQTNDLSIVLNLNDNNIQTLYNYNVSNYYLMGHKAIDKEINLIQDRKYENFELIKEKIDFYKKEKVDLIKYDINSIEVKSLRNTKFILISAIFIGLSLGLLFVVISDQFGSKAFTKKRSLL